MAGNFLVAGELHRVLALATGDRAQIRCVAEHLRHRDFGLDFRHFRTGRFHPQRAAPAGVQIADHVSNGVLGNAHRDQHDRLEQHRPGIGQRLLHRQRARDLERHLGGIDGVVGAVVEPHAQILDRVAGDGALLHGLLHALLDGGDESRGDHPALDGVYELEPCARLERLDLDVAVPELATTAGLLLVAPVSLGRLSDGFLIGHARRLELDLDAEARAQPLDDHLDVHLRETGDDLLAGLLVAVQIDRRILLLEAPERCEDLVLVSLALGLDRERHHRRRQPDLRHLHRLVARGKPIAGFRLLELRHRADVTRTEVSRMTGLVALEGDQRPNALLGVSARVEHLRVLLDDALVDAEQVDAPGERIGAGLEDVGEHLFVLDRFERQLADLEPAVLYRRRKILDDRVEQPVGAEVARRHPAGDREDRAVIGAVL